MAVHEKIRALRLGRGYKQNYMAFRLDIDTANYGRMERGQTKITLDRLEAIAEILGVELNDLLNNDADDNEELNQALNHQQKETNQILKHILSELKQIRQQLLKQSK